MKQLIREAKIISVNKENLTCQIEYGDSRDSERSEDVPLLNLLGAGNSGMIFIPAPGTRVIVAFLGSYSRDIVHILSYLPSYSQRVFFGEPQKVAGDLPIGSQKYNVTNSGELYLSSHTGSNLYLKNDNEFFLGINNGRGLIFKAKEARTSLDLLSSNQSLISSGGRMMIGEARRAQKFIIPKGDNELIPYNKDWFELTEPCGFFTNYKRIDSPIAYEKRNPGLSEYRLIVNEFTPESLFSGFDDELKRIKKELKEQNIDFKNNDITNLLGLSRGELIEVIAGNVIDTNGLQLDLNYKYMVIGDSSGKYPEKNIDSAFNDIVRKSRRAIGYHFQLNSTYLNNEQTTSTKNFVFDLDKEGILKLNVPASTQTGNIIYPTVTNFAAGSDKTVVVSKPANPSVEKYIPVTLRDESGEPLPKTIKSDKRSTGVRFQTERGIERINQTAHHNILEVAERLIANKIKKINIPSSFSKTNDLGEKVVPDANYLGINKPFERWEDGEIDEKTDLGYSTINVYPENPAISSGGDTIICGKNISKNDSNDKIISNQYKTTISDNQSTLSETIASGQQSSGGVSGNINLKGALYLSLGKDDVDSKSFILDTAGAIIMWAGKDKNNRSIVAQTDGEVLINIGGTYSEDESENPKMNKGALNIRVNVTDKGFYSKNIAEPSDKEMISDSDYIFSISEKGLVISGGINMPMLIRNKGSIMIESTEGDIVLKGNEIRQVQFGREDMSVGKPNLSKVR